MPTPADTIRLLRSLELIAESVQKLEHRIEAVLNEIGASGTAEISRVLSEAAIDAGMPASRAYDYAEEYAAAMARMRSALGALVVPAQQAQSHAETLVHIARVVPHRCPNHERTGGRPVLVLR